MPLETSEKKASNIMKLTVVILGSFCILLVFLVDKLGTVLELSISLGGVTVGPLLGLFILGMCLPIANAKVLFLFPNKDFNLICMLLGRTLGWFGFAFHNELAHF